MKFQDLILALNRFWSERGRRSSMTRVSELLFARRMTVATGAKTDSSIWSPSWVPRSASTPMTRIREPLKRTVRPRAFSLPKSSCATVWPRTTTAAPRVMSPGGRKVPAASSRRCIRSKAATVPTIGTWRLRPPWRSWPEVAETGIASRTAVIRRPRWRASSSVRSFGMPPIPIGMPPVVSLRPGAITMIELPRLANWSST